MLEIGDRAPEFSASDQHGTTHALSAMLERGGVVVYFYPVDFSPVCTMEACAFRDRYEALDAVDVQIVGVSPQSADSHRRFAEFHRLPFPLLADPDKRIIRAYGVDGPLGFGVRRATFYIGPDGTIENRVVSDLFVGGHVDLIRKLLEQRRKS